MSNTAVCPKCQSTAKRTGSTLSDPPSPIYGCTLCGWEFRGVDAPFPKTPAEKALERDEKRREEEHAAWMQDHADRRESHALHVRFMEKQLATMDAEAAYRAVLQEHHIRQTEALEGILRYLTARKS